MPTWIEADKIQGFMEDPEEWYLWELRLDLGQGFIDPISVEL